jgi:hypothetical protein
MHLRLRLRTMQIAVGMAAIAMIAVRMSVPDTRTFVRFLPPICFAVIGVWMAVLRGWSAIPAGVAGGLVGAFSTVATRIVYYRYWHYDPYANVNYLGPEYCLIVNSLAGSVAGAVLGVMAWIDSIL